MTLAVCVVVLALAGEGWRRHRVHVQVHNAEVALRLSADALTYRKRRRNFRVDREHREHLEYPDAYRHRYLD